MVLSNTNYQLDEIAHLRNGAGIKQDSFGENGIPIVRVSDFTENSVDLSQAIFLRREKLDRWKSFRLEIDEILVSTVGSWGTSATSAVGKVVRIPKTAVNCIQNQNTCSIKAIKGIASQRWIYYALKHPDFKHFVDGAAAGSANQARLAVKNLRKYTLAVPSLSDQEAIAHILGILDDKIELNEKIHQTLEEIAKAIFKSWFVDFDPVRAKAEGRLTGLPPEICKLFPDQFVESEVGEVPRDWEYVPMDSLTLTMSRGIAPDYTEDETYPVINQKCIRNFDINFDLCRFTKHKKNMEQRFLKPFDTLVNSMGVGTLGRASLFVDYDKDVLVDGLITVVRGVTEVESLFLYQHLSSRESEIINLSTGSTGQTSLKVQDLGSINIVRPPQALLDVFAENTRDMYKRRRMCTMENKVLAEIRDLLLPKLISGELRIPDAEKFLEEAGI